MEPCDDDFSAWAQVRWPSMSSSADCDDWEVEVAAPAESADAPARQFGARSCAADSIASSPPLECPSPSRASSARHSPLSTPRPRGSAATHTPSPGQSPIEAATPLATPSTWQVPSPNRPPTDPRRAQLDERRLPLDEFEASMAEGDEQRALLTLRGRQGMNPLYRMPDYQSQLAYDEAVLLSAAFRLQCSMSARGREDLSNFCNALLPDPNLIIGDREVERFLHKQLFEADMRIELYCQRCEEPIAGETAHCANPSCARYGATIRTTRESSYKAVAVCSVCQQLVDIVVRNAELLAAIEKEAEDETPDVRRELSDWENMRDTLQMFRTSHPLLLTLATDGFPLRGSSLRGCWAAYLQIANLPLRLRSRVENTVVVGLYLGPGIPSQRDFRRLFARLIDDLHQNAPNGLPLPVPMPHNERVVAGMYSVACDLEASAALFNMVRWNGAYACTHCEEPGCSAAAVGAHGGYIYPVDTDVIKRTDDRITMQIAVAEASGGHLGFHGASVTQCLHFNCTRRMPDALHLFGEGICKDIFRRCTAPMREFPCHSLRPDLPLIDAAINACLFPTALRYMVNRSLSSIMTASGSQRLLVSIFIMPAIIVLDVLPDQPTAMVLLLLLTTIRIMALPYLSGEDRDACTAILVALRRLYPTFIGVIYCTLKIHLLLCHVPDLLANEGTPFDTDTASFETVNYWLKECLIRHQSRGLLKTILERFLLLRRVMPAFGRMASGSSIEGVRELAASWNCMPNAPEAAAGERVSLPPGCQPCAVPTEIRMELRACGVLDDADVFARIKIDGLSFTSFLWHSNFKSDDSGIVYSENGVKRSGRVRCYVRQDSVFAALVYPYKTCNASLNKLLRATERSLGAHPDGASFRPLVEQCLRPYAFWADLINDEVKPELIPANNIVGHCALFSLRADGPTIVIDLSLKRFSR